VYKLSGAFMFALSITILSCQLCQASFLEHSWSRTFGGSGSDAALSVAKVSDGGVIITGQFAGTVDFGGGPLVSTGSQNPGWSCPDSVDG
jgi:hypothetical protein